MRFIGLAALLLAQPALAHDFHEMAVTNVSEKSVFTSIILSDTVKGVSVSCALFDADGAAIAQANAITENLATEVLIQTPETPVANARCVVSE